MGDPWFLFDRLLRIVPCRLFLDVGSRDGESALKAANLLDDADFILFEAAPDNFRRMSEDPRLRSDRFTLEHRAVADRSGLLRFHIYRNPGAPGNRGLSSLKRRKELDPVDVVEVEAVTLDGYLAARGLLDSVRDVVLWIDVEGAAFEVLRGGPRTLEGTSLVFVEVEVEAIYDDGHTRGDVRGLLAAAGFRELAYSAHSGGRKGDALFVREEVYERYGVARRLGKWRWASRVQRLKRAAYERLRRHPVLHGLWRRVKPADEDPGAGGAP